MHYKRSTDVRKIEFKNQLNLQKADFGLLLTELSCLEISGLLLIESPKIIQYVEESLENVPIHLGEMIEFQYGKIKYA